MFIKNKLSSETKLSFAADLKMVIIILFNLDSKISFENKFARSFCLKRA